MVRVEHLEVERPEASAPPRAERQREREVGIRGSRHGRHAEDAASPVVRPGHAGRDDHRFVAERLEVTPDRLDGRGHAAEHREVIVREETDSQAQGPQSGYILYLPKSSGFRFSSHSFNFS